MKRLAAGFALATAMIAAGSGTTAGAAALRDPSEALFAVGDTNGDGKLDLSEMEALRHKRFERLDKNRDGVLSQAELDQAQNQVSRAAEIAKTLMETGFGRLDADGNGVVSEDEFVKRGPGLVAFLLDVNGDGAISRSEFDRLIEGLSHI